MAQTRLRMVLDDESPYADFMLRAKPALLVPDTQRLTKPSYYNYESSPEKEVVEYRIPEIEEFVPGFEFEFKSNYASDGTERWVSHTVKPLFDARTAQAYLKEDKIRTKTSKPTEFLVTNPAITDMDKREEYKWEKLREWTKKQDYTPTLLKLIPSRKEITPIKTNELIQETQCPQCKGIIFYTTEPLCPICEFQGLKHL